MPDGSETSADPCAAACAATTPGPATPECEQCHQQHHDPCFNTCETPTFSCYQACSTQCEEGPYSNKCQDCTHIENTECSPCMQCHMDILSTEDPCYNSCHTGNQEDCQACEDGHYAVVVPD